MAHTRQLSKKITFRFPTSKRPAYYEGIAKRYSEVCAQRGERLIALARADGPGHLKAHLCCAEGHRFWAVGRHFLDGTAKCERCRVEQIRRVKAHRREELAAVAKTRGDVLLSEHYVNARTNLRWQCVDGHVWSTSADNYVNKGSGCPECALHALWDARDRAHRKRRADKAINYRRWSRR